MPGPERAFRLLWLKAGFATHSLCLGQSWAKVLLSLPRQPPFGFSHCASSFQVLSGQKAGKLRVTGLVLPPQSLLSLSIPFRLPRVGLDRRHFCKVRTTETRPLTQGLQSSEAKDMTLERRTQSGLKF